MNRQGAPVSDTPSSLRRNLTKGCMSLPAGRGATPSLLRVALKSFMTITAIC